MPFQPGVSGNPGGRRTEKLFYNALQRAVRQDETDQEHSPTKQGTRLRQAAEALLNAAASGEAWAISLLAQRLDGNPAQPITDADGESLPIQMVATAEALRLALRKPDVPDVPAQM